MSRTDKTRTLVSGTEEKERTVVERLIGNEPIRQVGSSNSKKKQGKLDARQRRRDVRDMKASTRCRNVDSIDAYSIDVKRSSSDRRSIKVVFFNKITEAVPA